ncbi:putative glucose-methanol-choline oxidoreductase [Actinomycetes bacterium]|nr:putative glucose-methanol-choline oxidoreductase [Actinomycetes bacterium]
MAAVRTVVVVGGGTAGCTVAGVLAMNKNYSVILLEAGPTINDDHERDFFGVLKSQDASVTRRSVSLTQTTSTDDYLQARGLGGGSAINAMVSVRGHEDDYNNWSQEFGCTEWSWSHVSRAFDALPLNLYEPNEDELGVVGKALLQAIPGAQRCALAWNNGRQSARIFLDLAQQLGALDVRTGAVVARVRIKDGKTTGVELSDGTVIVADDVVLCSGALATPHVLWASGCQHSAIGRGLQDHPAVMFSTTLDKPAAQGFVVTSHVSIALDGVPDAGQMMAYNHLGDPTRTLGGLGVALTHVWSRGHISVNGANMQVQFNMLSDSRDRHAMRELVRLAVTHTSTHAMSAIGAGWTCDENARPCSELLDLSDDELDTWVSSHLGHQSHAVGTCRMGSAQDPNAVVSPHGQVHGVSSLWVADASVFPRIPRANTNLPVTMVAARIANFISESARP